MVGLIGVVLVQPGLISTVLGHEVAGHISAHFRFRHHRVHDLTFGLVFGTGVVGMLAQLRSPANHVAGQLMALIPWVVLALTSALTSRFVFAPLPVLGGLTLAAALLHPTARDVLRSFRVSRVNRVILALVVIAAGPLLAFAFTNIGLQKAATNDHAALGHYGFMAALSFTVIGTGLLACLQLPGWRLTGWVAGLLAALLGIVSLAYPDVDSSLGRFWVVAAIGWGLGFVASVDFWWRRGARSPVATAAVH